VRKLLGIFSLLFLLPAAAHADTPSFDRPGISFSSAVLPVGSFDWEQGLPDLQRDNTDGVRTTSYTADTTFRYGLARTVEVQLTGSLWNRHDLRTLGMTSHGQGPGDTRISLKLSNTNVSLAVLGGITFATGAAEFTNGRSIYSLGAVIGRDLGAGRSIAAYGNVDRSGGVDTWTFSANVGFPVHGNLGGFVELGRVFDGGSSSTVAGGGLTWLLHELYARRGVTSSSPDLQAGLGISVFWK
jgi:hypothetical protein